MKVARRSSTVQPNLEFPSEAQPPAATVSRKYCPRADQISALDSTTTAGTDPRYVSLFTRDTRLALASCAFGVVVGVLSMWMAMTVRTSSALSLRETITIAQGTPRQTLPEDKKPSPLPGLASPSGEAQIDKRPVVSNVAARPPAERSRAVAYSTVTGSGQSSFRGTLTLRSIPSGAKAFIDGKTIGVTPIVVNRVPAGSRVVRITADGYQPWSSAVRIVANQRNPVTVRLQPALR